MKKIIVALDGLNFSASAAKYAAFLAASSKAGLTGVFLDDEGVSGGRLKELKEKDEQIRKESVKEFEKICDQEKIKFKVRHDRNTALQELLTESIYADILVIDRKETFCQNEEKMPGSFLRSTLNNMECPALVVPSSFKAIHKLVFLYDGGPSSVHAFKAFCYLLNAFHGLSLEIVTVKQALNYPDLSGKYLLNEWVKKYFPTVAYKVLQGDPETAIVQYAKTQKSNSLFILGARQRGMLSHWFRESMADVLIQNVKAPLFIVRY